MSDYQKLDEACSIKFSKDLKTAKLLVNRTKLKQVSKDPYFVYVNRFYTHGNYIHGSAWKSVATADSDVGVMIFPDFKKAKQWMRQHLGI